MPNTPAFSWGRFDPPFVKEFVTWLDGRRVLEVFAGNGLLASRLANLGVDILATSLFTGHDGHEWGFHHAVTDMSAIDAVRSLGDERDVLLMSWAPATEAATGATLAWGVERPIVFVGEITDPDIGLGGCASDRFFELTRMEHEFGSYRPRNLLERACVRRLDPELGIGALAMDGPSLRKGLRPVLTDRADREDQKTGRNEREQKSEIRSRHLLHDDCKADDDHRNADERGER